MVRGGCSVHGSTADATTEMNHQCTRLTKSKPPLAIIGKHNMKHKRTGELIFSRKTKGHFGRLPARYRLALNQDSIADFNQCPKCNGSTRSRKFTLLIHVEVFLSRKSEVIGNPYLVMGTVEIRTWRKGLQLANTLEQVLDKAADFKHQLTVHSAPS
jgi:hypothetical protein